MAESDARTDGYRIADALPVTVDDVEPGTNLLVSGPAMSGKRRLTFDLLVPGTDDPDPTVVMTTDDPVSRVRRELESRGVASDPTAVRVVDASGAPSDGDDHGSLVRRVSSPADLTSMGVAFTSVVDEMGNPSRLRLGFRSVSTLLQYVDPEQAFSFLHVLSRRTSAAGYLGVYSIDPTTHEERFVNVVTSIFDAALEIRETDAGRELRIRGLPDVGSAWRPFPYRSSGSNS